MFRHQALSTKALRKTSFISLGLAVFVPALLGGCSDQAPPQTGDAADNATASVTSNAATNAEMTDTTTNSATNSASGMATSSEVPGKAVAVLHPTKGSNVRGTVTFTSEAGGVRITANVTGLAPGAHGFHAHQNGDCSALDASSAGGHFNPTNEPHSSPENQQRHAGDFGNMTADANGRAQYNKLDTKISLDGPNSIVGRAIIVHAKVDDLKTQPTGDAGGREACGVVGIASAE